jgi:hypothetical protein
LALVEVLAVNVVISVSHRFERTPDGAVWTPASLSYPFWQQYLAVFDGVRIVARVGAVAAVPVGWKRADGEGVELAAVPYYRGPWQ